MSKKAAFTMVELIFVIVILGILAAVAVPKLNASREDAKLTKYVTDVVTIMRDVRSYYAANGDLVRRIAYPAGVSEEDCKNNAVLRNQLIWQNGKCYGRENLSWDSDNISHITNVALKHDDNYSTLAIEEKDCLVFGAGNYTMNSAETDKFLVRSLALPDANASGIMALCKRLLAHPAVKAALTNEKGYTVGVKGYNGSTCSDECTTDFNLGSSAISWD